MNTQMNHAPSGFRTHDPSIRHIKHMTVDDTETCEYLANQIMEYQDLDNDFNPNSLLIFLILKIKILF